MFTTYNFNQSYYPCPYTKVLVGPDGLKAFMLLTAFQKIGSAPFLKYCNNANKVVFEIIIVIE